MTQAEVDKLELTARRLASQRDRLTEEVKRLREELRIARGDLTAAERHSREFLNGTSDARQDNA